MVSGRDVPTGLDGVEGDAPVLDLEVIESLRELGGEDEPDLLLELVDLFLDDSQRRIEQMQLALERGNLEEVARAAHTIKSAAANMGARLLSGLCTEIEALARQSRTGGLEERARSCAVVFEATAEALRGVDA